MKNLVAFYAIITIMSCHSHINPSYTALSGSFDKEGHRGCRGLMPENTIPAYLHAIDLGVTTIEMDAIISADGAVVMSHEPFFNHEITTKPDGSFVSQAEEKSLNMYKMNYAEIKTFDVGLKPHPRFPQQQKLAAIKPLLTAVIDSVEAYTTATGKSPVQYNIETKCLPETDDIFHPKPAVFVEKIMTIVLERHIESRVIIQSFDIRSLQYLHQHYPTIKTTLLIEETDTKSFALQLKDLGFIPTIYSPAYQLVKPLLVKQCHDTGIQIIPWTVNDATEIARLRNIGVDGIISDYPNLFNQPLK
jgi:glycerophosphoryl diester phosphodiesterase